MSVDDSVYDQDFSFPDLFAPACWMHESNADVGNASFLTVVTLYSNAVKAKVVEYKHLEDNLLLEVPDVSEELLSASGRHISMLFSDEWAYYEHEAMRYVWWSAYQILSLFYSEERIIEVSNEWIGSKCDGLIYQFVEMIERWDEVKNFPIEWAISLMRDSERDFEKMIWLTRSKNRDRKMNDKFFEEQLKASSWFALPEIRV